MEFSQLPYAQPKVSLAPKGSGGNDNGDAPLSRDGDVAGLVLEGVGCNFLIFWGCVVPLFIFNIIWGPSCNFFLHIEK